MCLINILCKLNYYDDRTKPDHRIKYSPGCSRQGQSVCVSSLLIMKFIGENISQILNIEKASFKLDTIISVFSNFFDSAVARSYSEKMFYEIFCLIHWKTPDLESYFYKSWRPRPVAVCFGLIVEYDKVLCW